VKMSCHARGVSRRMWVGALLIALAGWEPFRSPDADVTAGNKAYSEGKWDDAIAAYDRAQSNPSVAPAANRDATFDREGRIVMHPLFVEGDDRLRVEADV